MYFRFLAVINEDLDTTSHEFINMFYVINEYFEWEHLLREVDIVCECTVRLF